jgi:outer membrane protein OmpA-like peptidoglycan-associated protein/tetratricopeptide (TPR) repeat protein
MKTYLQLISLLIIAFLSFNVSYSQKGKIEKANKEYDQYSYIDAQKIYLKVVEDGYSSSEIYKRLGDTYYYNSDYSNAAIWYSRLISEFPDEAETNYYYKAAQSLKSEKKYAESDTMMEAYIAKGGKGIVAQNFKNNPNYLKSIAEGAKEYSLEKVGINTESSDYGPSFYMDKIVFASNSQNFIGAKLSDWDDQPYMDLYQADMDERGVLSNASRLKGDINTPYHESSTAFTKDGNTVYFTRNNFLDDKKGRDKTKTIRLKIYKATKDGNSWGNIKELPFNDDTYSVAHPTLSLDEKRLYFSSDMTGGIGESDLWYVDILGNDTYSEPINLGSSINTEARETFPYISDGNNLYFSTDGRSGLGGLDIFVSPLDNEGKPGEMTNLGEPANSNKDDFGFIFNEEKHFGYVSSNRDGEGGSIGDDIYFVQEECVITIGGLVTDKDSGELVPGALVQLLDGNNKLIEEQIVGDNANYSFTADCNSQYSVRGTKERYAPDEKIVQTPNKTGSINVPLQLKLVDPCAPNDLGCRLTLQPIYFDFDRFNIREDAAIELAKILVAMREYPQLVIHIESHTDSRGDDTYNEILSEKRAQSTLDWLVDQGIDRKRLSAKGYGEYQLVNHCSNGIECTEEEHQLNRRSMFIIQN